MTNDEKEARPFFLALAFCAGDGVGWRRALSGSPLVFFCLAHFLLCFFFFIEFFFKKKATNLIRSAPSDRVSGRARQKFEGFT